MPEELKMKIRGVYTNPNHMSEVPLGALSYAKDCVLDRESVLQPRRGLKVHGTPPAGAGVAVRQIFPYEDQLIAHYGTTLAQDDGAGNFSPYSGTFTEPAAIFRTRAAISNKNLYLTTAEGVRRLDGLGSTFAAAGVAQPLDATAALAGSSGFLTGDTNVAYRGVLVFEDAKENEHPSAPSQRVVVTNALGGGNDRTVDLTWYLPSDAAVGYLFRLYRSAVTVSLTAEPSDELQLVYEAALTSTDISNGYVTLNDSTPDSLRGETLYTSPSEQGITEQNDRPPLAYDLALYKNHMVYANVRSKHRLLFSFIGVGPGAFTYVSETGDTTMGSAVVDDIGDTSNMHVGMRVSGTGIPSSARILTIDSGTQITLTENATANGNDVAIECQDIITIAGEEYFAASATSLADHEFEATIGSTPATNIELTALSLVFAINQDPTNTSVYAYYASQFEDIPGAIEIVERGIGGSTFTAQSTEGTSFNPVLTNAVSSSNTELPNNVLIAKVGEPEAVPLKNKFTAGADDIWRVIALRDAAILLGQQKIYRLSGNSISTFDIEELDSTARLIAPQSAVAFNNAVFCLTNQGVVRIDSSGSVRVLSEPIFDELNRVTSDLFTDAIDLIFGVAYESARRYILFIQNTTSDDTPTRAWGFNTFTEAWAGPWVMPRTCGVVNPADDKLYLGDKALGAVYQERKSFTRTDYADEEYPVTITSSSGTTVNVSSSADMAAGQLLVQDFRESLITEVTDGATVEVATELAWEAAAATVYNPIDTDVDWVPNTAQNPTVMKHFQEAVLVFRDADFASLQLTQSTNFRAVEESVTLFARDLQGGWGVAPFGSIPWGQPFRGEQVLRTQVRRNMSRAHWINLGITASNVFSSFALSGVGLFFEPMSRRWAGGVGGAASGG